MNWQNIHSNPKRLVLINSLLPFCLIILFLIISSDYFFNIGYFLYGWVEVLGLSTFVSMVPGVASWLLFGQLNLVGSEATANFTISGLIFLGSILILVGYLRSFQKNETGEMKGRVLLLIGGILTLPLGIISLYIYQKTKTKVSDLSFKERVVGELRKNKLPYLLVIPALIFLFFSYIIPILRGFYITLFEFPTGHSAFFGVNYDEDPLLWTIHAILGGLQRQEPLFIGVDNYLELFSNSTRATAFQNALNNNIYFVILFVPGVIIISLGLAVLLNSKLLKGENAYTTIFYMPVITSVIVVSVIWLRVVFPVDGLLTIIFTTFAPLHDGFFALANLSTLGIVPANVIEGNINWLANDKMIESVALMSIWRSVGFDVLILLAGLKSIPASLYEAADIDGHGSWSKFKNITMPNLKGALGVVIILELINGWQIFQEFYGLNLATFGGDQSLAIFLIANFADVRVMTFASTVGYFIFGMTAFIGLLGRMDIKIVLKGFALFSLLAVLFSIPSNRGISPKSLGFTISWLTYDLFFLTLAFLLLFYYVYYSLLKYKELDDDRKDLRITGLFVLSVSPFYLLNGYDTITRGGAGSTPIIIFDLPIPSLFFGLLMVVIAILMISAYYLSPYLKKQSYASFLFPKDDAQGV